MRPTSARVFCGDPAPTSDSTSYCTCWSRGTTLPGCVKTTPVATPAEGNLAKYACVAEAARERNAGVGTQAISVLMLRPRMYSPATKNCATPRRIGPPRLNDG